MHARDWIVAAALACAATTAFAAGSSSSSSRPEKDSTYDQAVSAVKAERFERARDLLERVVRRDPENADAWNWLGFSHRNLGDHDQALAAYEKALAIDPEHRGALEYLGELYVQTGQMEEAREQLRKLDDACGMFGCEEYDDLKASIERKSSGG